MVELILLLVGAIIGVIFSVMLEESFSQAWQKVKITFQRGSRRLLGTETTVLPQPHEFTLCDITAKFVVVDGNGEEEYRRENLRCSYDNEDLELPKDITAIRAEIENEQILAKSLGKPYYWNGELYGLEKFVRSRTLFEEDLVLELYFRPSDYYTFLATSMSLDRHVTDANGNNVTIREKYLQDIDPESVIPFLATACGVSVVVITSDDFLVVGERGKRGVGAWQNHFSVSVNEALSRVADWDESRNPSLYRAIIRGAQEELGIDIDVSSVRFLTFGFETIHYQWGISGMARVSSTAVQIRDWRTVGVKDKWENKELHYVPFSVGGVVDFILSHKPWTPFGIVSVLHTLIHEFGKGQVEKAIKDYQRTHS